MPTDAIPLASWADTQCRAIARLTGSPSIAAIRGAGILGQRAMLNGFSVPGRVSAGGGCALFATCDGHVALNLSRPDDRDMLPALFGDEIPDPAVAFARSTATHIVARGRALGLAIAALDERPASPACLVTATGTRRTAPARPFIVDLSALWAGPLAAHVMMRGGADVVKVESVNRPDSMRDGDAALFALLNDGKAPTTLDLRDSAGRDALLDLIRRADIVIEAARPRALLQLGIDADRMVREVPGLVWVTITGHGIAGDAGNWVGFGDDCGVAGGLSAALRDATGKIGFAGDAIADPLTGLYAARMALEQRQSGEAARQILSMSGVVAQALAAERARDEAALIETLTVWANREGQRFPSC